MNIGKKKNEMGTVPNYVHSISNFQYFTKQMKKNKYFLVSNFLLYVSTFFNKTNEFMKLILCILRI
jgi:hypothetical protein